MPKPKQISRFDSQDYWRAVVHKAGLYKASFTPLEILLLGGAIAAAVSAQALAVAEKLPRPAPEFPAMVDTFTATLQVLAEMQPHELAALREKVALQIPKTTV